MRAFVLTGYGGPENTELRDMPKPMPGAGEVLVRVAAAGLNPVDWKIREGQLRTVLRPDLPATAGNELAGTVEAVGSAAKKFVVGDKVYARTGKDALGAFAEYAVVDEDHLAAMPESLDFVEAAAIPLAALTALQAIRDELQVGQGFRLLITGGAGGVGTFAIQIAKALGAHVITTASPRGRELVESLGADEVVNYENVQFEDEIAPVDGAFDLVGGTTLSRCFEIVKKGGRVVSVAGMPEPRTARQDMDGGSALVALFWVASAKYRMQARLAGVDYRYLFMHPGGSELAELARMVECGKLRPVIDSTYAFAEIADAMAELERGHAKGKIVVTMGGES
ncbi:NADP-dependent oxidoreductase [Aurantiacibacter aquimixticola]|uniref:NADP-dependent oxidoreductase n=1 Tax=Aurantiacibacter aquimixticola TaxID=1958945 RepID=A0A419RQL1_9SPHN|nr:NADP-dependent oxidoreductase [Aurantiacibacter aquimixticola]RJY08069.1 NADP-dependent oxidoreductase [Aurantiacibacter aquimixticola]